MTDTGSQNGDGRAFERSEADVLAELERRLESDLTYAGGRILGSMISAPHPLGVDVLARYAEKNVGDPGLFPATDELEREAVEELGRWLGHPAAVGHLVSGGNEANILALWCARTRARAAGRRDAHVVLVPSHAHVSYDKAARLLDLQIVRVPSGADHVLDLDAARALIDERTLALVGAAGSTDLGLVDPLAGLSELALEHGLHLHVDAAFGGYVLPFLAELGREAPAFDFSLPGVATLTVDPHKMGLAPRPGGGLLFRDEAMQRAVSVDIDYLAGGRTSQATLTGTRPGSAALAVWALLKHLGRTGYREVVRSCMAATDELTARLAARDDVDVRTIPVTNVVGLVPRDVPVGLAVRRLREAGWAVGEFAGHLRIVLLPHVTEPSLDAFLVDLAHALRSDLAPAAG